MAWQTPITDRTELDVIARNEKGTYNAADLNRVGECVQILADVLNMYGYFATVDVKTDWEVGDIPTVTDMETYLENIDNLINASYTLARTPPLPDSMMYLDWRKANAIEKILVDMKEVITRMITHFRYSGTFKANEKTLPQFSDFVEGSSICGYFECGEAECGNYIIRNGVDN